MTKHLDPDKASNGTQFFGHHFVTTSARLRELFGEPTYPDGDWTIDEWVLDMHGAAVTVYHRGDTHYPLKHPHWYTAS